MSNHLHQEMPLSDVNTDELLVLQVRHQEVSDQIFVKLGGIESQVEALSNTFEKRLSYDKEKERAFDLLYSELQELKANSAFDNIKSLYLDLILLLDRIQNIKDCIIEERDHSISTKNILQSVIDEVLETLLRQEVEVISNDLGTTFDPHTQKAIQTQETQIESENNKVFRFIRRGFRYGERILRPEEVIVSKYRRT